MGWWLLATTAVPINLQTAETPIRHYTPIPAECNLKSERNPPWVPVSNATLDKDTLYPDRGTGKRAVDYLQIHGSLCQNGRRASQRSQNEGYVRDAEKMPNLKHIHPFQRNALRIPRYLKSERNPPVGTCDQHDTGQGHPDTAADAVVLFPCIHGRQTSLYFSSSSVYVLK